MKKRKGASSILVLFMVVVLITLGLFTIVSANINFRLSKKSVTWNQTYYELDSLCEEKLGLIDKALFEAEQEAVKKISENLEQYTKENVYEELNNEYKKISENKLKNLEFNNSEVTIGTFEDTTIDYLEFGFVEKSLSDENYQINVQLKIKDILYDTNINGGNIELKKIYNENRYDIIKWKQYQEIIVDEDANKVEIWDPREDLDFEP